jgi:P27 family predicted phage terminase small subunit
MARPAKAIAAKTAKISKDETEQRLQIEDQLRGRSDKLLPPLYLTDEQVEIFNYVLEELNEAKVLGNLDLFALSQLSICVDRMQEIEKEINENKTMLLDKTLMQTRDRYARDFIRLCNEFCMSPQSRAKLSISTVKPGQEKKKTLMELLNEDDEEE